MPPSVVIREAIPDDARGIAVVHVGTWQSAYRGLIPDEFLDALDIDRRLAAYAELGMLSDENRPIWVAECRGEIVGFVNVGPSKDEEGVGELYAIYVASAYWDTGAGRELVKRGLEWLAARYEQATLWVLDGNERARSFYERGGWFFDGATKEDGRGTFVLHEVRYRITL
jgi:GNAT superfamily N-acetyltransferase